MSCRYAVGNDRCQYESYTQAILSFRALVQSNRFERAWTLLAHTYKAEVTALDNVVPIRSWR